MKRRQRAGSTTMLALAFGLLPASVLPGVLKAQTGSQSSGLEGQTAKPGIRVAPVILAEPEVETSISIQIVPESAVPRQTFLRLRGVPIAAKLSEGHVVTPGVWAVPLAALPSLRLLAPLASSGRTEILIALVGVDGTVLAETKSSLVVAPAWLLGTAGQRPDSVRIVPRAEPGAPEAVVAVQPPAATPPVEQRRAAPVATEPAPPPVTAAPPPPPPPVARPQPPAAPVMAALPPPAPLLAPPPPLAVVTPPPAPPPAAKTSPPAVPPPAAVIAPAPKSPPVLSAADKERAEALVQRGDGFMRQANVAAARQFFRRAADMGLAAGALRLGATYDPAELTARTIVGITPDPKEASIWYERARELGAPEAGARLSRLQGR